MAVSPKQMASYWRMFSAACSNQGMASREQREAYRHNVLKVAGNVTSTKLLTQTSYEAVMARMADDAGDYEAASWYGSAQGRRYIVVAGDLIRQISEIIGCTIDQAAYIEGIVRQAKLGFMERTPDGSLCFNLNNDSLSIAFKILDTRRRKLIKDTQADTRGMLQYKKGRIWFRTPEGHLSYRDGGNVQPFCKVVAV